MHALALLLLLVTGAVAEPAKVDRIVWERHDLLPPKTPEKLRLRVMTTSQAGVTLFTRLYQLGDVWQRRLENVIYEVPGEELKAASMCDLNDDGVQEVLLQFCPPLDQSQSRLVVFSYGRRARKYVKIFEKGPAKLLKARWVVLSAPRNDLGEKGLAIDELKADGYTPARTATYRFQGERLHTVLK